MFTPLAVISGISGHHDTHVNMSKTANRTPGTAETTIVCCSLAFAETKLATMFDGIVAIPMFTGLLGSSRSMSKTWPSMLMREATGYGHFDDQKLA